MLEVLHDRDGSIYHDQFQEWRRRYPEGIFLTLETKSKANLHGSQCQHLGSTEWSFDETERQSLTKKRKVLGYSNSSLNVWAKLNSVVVHLCQHCVRDGFVSDAFFEHSEPEAEAMDSQEILITDEAKNLNQNVAGELVREWLPILAERTFVLHQLLASADLANSIAPNAWAVSLFKNGFRLNVGQVEVLVFIDGKLRVNLIGAAGMAPFFGPEFEVANYRTVPQPHCAFIGSVEDFSSVEPSLRSSHELFVKRAATTQFGQPRKGTPFRRSHSELLIDFARSATAEPEKTLPTLVENLTSPDMERRFDLEAAKAIEGYQLDRIILARGRNANLAVMRKIRDQFTCQACNFKLQLDNKFVIEVHHLQPLAATGETETSIEQLISLCPTCHRISHLRSPPYSVEEIREFLTHCSSQSDAEKPSSHPLN